MAMNTLLLIERAEPVLDTFLQSMNVSLKGRGVDRKIAVILMICRPELLFQRFSEAGSGGLGKVQGYQHLFS